MANSGTRDLLEERLVRRDRWYETGEQPQLRYCSGPSADTHRTERKRPSGRAPSHRAQNQLLGGGGSSGGRVPFKEGAGGRLARSHRSPHSCGPREPPLPWAQPRSGVQLWASRT